MPPRIALIAMVAMLILHIMLPLAIIVPAPFSYTGAVGGSGRRHSRVVASSVPSSSDSDQAVHEIHGVDSPRPLWLEP
jgi:hypothetical protein